MNARRSPVNRLSGVTQLRNRRGAASALIILLLVLLIFFGVLTLVTAAADWRLAQRRADWSTSYYQVDCQGQQVMARISNVYRETDIAGSDMQSQADQLRSSLENTGIADLDIRVEENQLRMVARVLDTAAEQGIDLILLIAPQGARQNPRIKVLRWSWWRKPFDYEAQADPLLKGNT